MQPSGPSENPEASILIDRQGMAKLQERYGRDLMNRLVSLHPEMKRQDREDILQEALLSFWRRFQGNRITNSWFLLQRILFRRAHDTRRRLEGPLSAESNERSLDDVPEEKFVWEGRSELRSFLRNQEIVDIVERICAGLPRRTQSIIRKRIFQGLTFEDIAELDGGSEKSNTLYRLFVRNLRMRMENLGIEMRDLLYDF